MTAKSAKIEKADIPRKTVYRLSIYSRCLQRLLENGIKTVSSEALAGAAGVKSRNCANYLFWSIRHARIGL